jgi:hypothetical protein
MMDGDTDIEEIAPVLPPEPVKAKRRSPADKWDAMNIQSRLDVLHDMEQRDMLPRGVLVRDYYAEWEALDMRFGNLLYDVQEKVVSYLRKNYDDLD